MLSYSKHIIIVGSARSGTSWLAETIAKQHRYRLLFEPDHEFQTNKGILICDKWIDSKEASPEAYRYIKAILANRVDSDWIAQNSNRKLKRHLWPIIPLKYVIKFVRANLMASYLQKEFGVPVIHILRNPYDTIASQQRVKFPWLYNLGHFTQQQALVAFVEAQFDFNLKNTDAFDDIEKLTIRWCLENVLPIEIWKVENIDYRVVKQEDLRTNMDLFRQLCATFHLKPIDNLKQVYTSPSSKTHPKSDVISKQKATALFTIEEYKKINDILSIFQTKLYPLKEL